MKKKIVFILFSVLLMTSIISYMAISKYQSSMKHFEKAGYILSSKKNTLSENKSNAYFFNNDTKYKNRYDETVIFADVNGEKIDVPEASFIHYNDNSIGVLKKAAILNLDEIVNQIPKYYNIFSNTNLQYYNNSYNANNLGKTISFKRFIVKISDKKYLIVSPNLTVYLDGETKTKIDTDYIELSFIDEKVTNIENKDVNYQTIGKEAYVDLGNNMTLNLDNHYVYIGDEAKVSIDQMIIDSSDNIEIQPVEKKTKEEQEDTNNQGTNNTNADDNSDAVEIEGNESEVVESELKVPTADISDLDITANKIEGTIKINDEDSLIVGTVTTKIIENSTGKVIDIIETDEGKYDIDISYNRLMPDTVYNLITTINYQKNDVLYNMDIVQNVFSTSSLGISLEKDYFTNDKIAYKVIFDEYSKVKSCNISIKNTNNEILETRTVTNTLSLEQSILFTGLKSNTKYIILVDNILYDDYIVSDDYSIETSAKTLKEKPSFGNPGFTIDKKNNQFILKLDGVTDKENGIESYKFQIFDKRTMNNGIPVSTVTKSNSSSLEINIDDKTIFRGVGYVYNVVIEFYDNEKYIEYVTPYSADMQIDGKEAPSLSWKETTITHEKIVGTVTIKDPGQIVDLTKPITVIYTNSIGTINQYTTEGSLNIPFNKNNLRANETYTISLYGTVNFQDGNPEVDNYFIGSVSINTKPTNPFNAQLTENNNVLDVFSVNAQLLNNPVADNVLEAKTLTGITFVLHEGQTINGRVVSEIEKIDKNTSEYQSELKEQYYDKSFTINPEFFGVKGKNLIADYYTIEIKNAYDYTDFKNEIGINNNSITVRARDGLPDIINPDDSIIYRFIKNSETDNPDPDLAPDTIVGINYKARYDNSRHSAKAITYKIFENKTDCSLEEGTCKEITSARKTVTIADDGIITEQYEEIGAGTSFYTNDNTIKRGNSYYILFDMDLDLDGDGIAETNIPLENQIYKSKKIQIPKQAPSVLMYPSWTTSSTINIKYQFTDIDNVVKDNYLNLSIKRRNGIETYISKKKLTKDDSFHELTFTGLEEGVLKFYTEDNYYKNNIEPDESHYTDEIHTYINQMFYQEYNPPNLKYHVENKTNRLIIKLEDYAIREDDYNRIAAYNVKISGKKNNQDYTREIKFKQSNEDEIIINLFDISEFMGQTIKVDVSALYDTDLISFDDNSEEETKYYALQKVTQTGRGEYLSVSDNGMLKYTSNIGKSLYEKTNTITAYQFKNVYSNETLEMLKKPVETGLQYNYYDMLSKKIGEKDLTTTNESDRNFAFGELTPGISLMNNKVSRITPMIDSVNISGTIYGNENNLLDIENSKIYIELYNTDELGTAFNLVKTTTCLIDELENGIDINELLPDTYYAVKFFAKVKSGNEYVRTQLYDVDEEDPAKAYIFKTLSGVNISGFTFYYDVKKYNEKNLIFSYNVDRTIGYDKIRYRIKKQVINEDTNEVYYEPVEGLTIPDDSILLKNMKLIIDVSPENNKFEYGNNYLLEVVPISVININGVEQEIELTNNGGEYLFTLPQQKTPFTVIRAKYTEGASEDHRNMTFIVNNYDASKMIVNGEYMIKLLNDQNEDITPSKYVGKHYDIKNYNAEFLMENLDIGNTYTIKVKYRIDEKNNGVDISWRSKNYSVRVLEQGEIDIGDMTVHRTGSNYLELYFSNSFSLTSIDTLNYSIYNTSDGTSINKSILFQPQERNVSGKKIYIQPLEDRITKYGVYYIQTQFLKKNVVIYDDGIEYTYLDSD